jgi:hypothetical protein
VIRKRRLSYPADRKRGYLAIERWARSVRAAVAPDAPAHAPLPGLQLFEGLTRYYVEAGGKRIFLTYGSKDMPEGAEALTVYMSERQKIGVFLSEDTYNNLEREQPRARFSLGHEIGHAVLHSAELVRLAALPHAESGLYRSSEHNHEICQDIEWQADAFAAAILMPAEGIRLIEEDATTPFQRAFIPSRIVSTFKVSRSAADRRWQIYQERREELL